MNIPAAEYAIWKPAIADLVKQANFPYKSIKPLNTAFGRCIDDTLKWTGEKKNSQFDVTIISRDQRTESETYHAGEKAILAIIVKETLTTQFQRKFGAEPCVKIATRSSICHSARCFCGRWAPYDIDSNTLTPCCDWLIFWINEDEGLQVSEAEKALQSERDRRPRPRETPSASAAEGTGEIGALKKERDELKTSLATHDRKLKGVMEERDAMKASVSSYDQRLRRVTNERVELNASLHTCDQKLKAMTKEQDDLKASVSTYDEKLKRVTKERDDLRVALDTCDQKLKRMTQERDDLKALETVYGAQEVDRITKARDDLEKDIIELKTLLDIRTGKLKEDARKRDILKEKLLSTREELAKCKEEREVLKVKLDDREGRLERVVAKLSNANEATQDTLSNAPTNQELQRKRRKIAALGSDGSDSEQNDEDQGNDTDGY